MRQHFFQNGSMLTKITNDIGTSAPIYNTELFDKEKVSKNKLLIKRKYK